MTSPSNLERRRFAVPLCGCHEFGIQRIARFTSCLSALSDLPTFRFNALCAVLRAGAPPLRHHRGPVDAAVVYGWLGHIELTGGRTQAWKQQRTTGCGDIGLAIGKCPNQRAVRQLLVPPAPECLRQVMFSTFARQIRCMRGTTIGEWNNMVDVALAGGDIAAGCPARQVPAADELGQRR